MVTAGVDTHRASKWKQVWQVRAPNRWNIQNSRHFHEYNYRKKK